MAKPFINIQQQIQQLKDRGLIINNELLATNFLTYEANYYKINGYFHLFQDIPNTFNANTTFENITELYYFDLHLRNLILLYTSIIETSFKNYASYIKSK